MIDRISTARTGVTRSSRPLAACILLSLCLAACNPTASGPSGSLRVGAAPDYIHPYVERPVYWQLDGEPIFLMGGSKEDNLFQIDDLEGHLDALVEAGGNYVRNTMSSRDSGNVWPFARTADGRYDLEEPSREYFERFARLLRAAEERGVVVQIELWDRFDYAREPWLSNPFRPENNVNFTEEESGLAAAYERHPNHNENPFFRSVPDEDHNELILRFQRAHVDRILDISLKHPNVLYTMDNETSASPHWGAYWARYVHEAAVEAGVTVYTTEMWDAWDLRDPQHRNTLDNPDLYAFADVSQNNHNVDQDHWDNLQWVRRYTEGAPRPLNNVKIYGADTGPYGTTRDGLERFWRNLVGGAASARFHRPTSGLGLGSLSKTHLASARMLLDEYDLFAAVPDEASAMLANREPNEAYLSFVAGRQYAVYFPDGGSVDLSLTGTAGPLRLIWLDVEANRWISPQTLEGGASVPLTTPNPGHWVALITVGTEPR